MCNIYFSGSLYVLVINDGAYISKFWKRCALTPGHRETIYSSINYTVIGSTNGLSSAQHLVIIWVSQSVEKVKKVAISHLENDV